VTDPEIKLSSSPDYAGDSYSMFVNVVGYDVDCGAVSLKVVGMCYLDAKGS
jgi:hypothetical protein